MSDEWRDILSGLRVDLADARRSEHVVVGGQGYARIVEAVQEAFCGMSSALEKSTVLGRWTGLFCMANDTDEVDGMDLLESALEELANQEDAAAQASAGMAREMLDVGGLIDMVHLGCLVRMHTAVDAYLMQTALLLKMLHMLVGDDGQATVQAELTDEAFDEALAAVQEEYREFERDCTQMGWRDRKDMLSVLGVHAYISEEVWSAFKMSRWARNDNVHYDDEPNYVGRVQHPDGRSIGVVGDRFLGSADLVGFNLVYEVYEGIWACAAFIEMLDESVSRDVFGETPGRLDGLSAPFKEYRESMG